MTGFNPEQLKRIALAKRLERDQKVDISKQEVEPLPAQDEVQKHVEEIEGYVVAAAEEGDLSYYHNFPTGSKVKLVNEVAVQFKTKHPKLMLVVHLGPTHSIIVSWDGLNHV